MSGTMQSDIAVCNDITGRSTERPSAAQVSQTTELPKADRRHMPANCTETNREIFLPPAHAAKLIVQALGTGYALMTAAGDVASWFGCILDARDAHKADLRTVAIVRCEDLAVMSRRNGKVYT